MSKFAILFCFLIALSQQATVEEYYDTVIYFFKGFAKDTQYKCYNTFVSQKSKILVIINKIVDEVKGGKPVKDAIMGHSLELMMVPNLANNCNLSNLVIKLPAFYSEKGVKDIGYALINHNTEVYNLIKAIIDNKDLTVKCEKAGELFKILTGLNVL